MQAVFDQTLRVDLERRACGRQRGCGGIMRMAMSGEGETSGFVGGIA